jgi:hypothetical protein
MTSRRWILTDVVKTPGKNGVTCHRFRWHGVEEGESLETTTDSTMRNWRLWQDLANDPKPWGIYENIRPSTRTTNRGYGVANADYRAELQDRIDTRDGAEWLVRELRKPSSATSTTFDDLFTDGDDK